MDPDVQQACLCLETPDDGARTLFIGWTGWTDSLQQGDAGPNVKMLIYQIILCTVILRCTTHNIR